MFANLVPSLEELPWFVTSHAELLRQNIIHLHFDLERGGAQLISTKLVSFYNQ